MNVKQILTLLIIFLSGSVIGTGVKKRHCGGYQLSYFKKHDLQFIDSIGKAIIQREILDEIDLDQWRLSVSNSSFVPCNKVIDIERTMQSRFKPDVRHSLFDLYYEYRYQGHPVSLIKLPVNEQFNLDTSVVYIDRVRKRLKQIEEIEVKAYHLNADSVMSKFKELGYKKYQYYGIMYHYRGKPVWVAFNYQWGE